MAGRGLGPGRVQQTGRGEYTGTYTDTVGKEPGKIELKWSRIERRFNGTWREGEDRFGDLSIRLADNEIRGALTTDPKSKINPPRLGDFSWTRVGPMSSGAAAALAEAIFGPVTERVLEKEWAIDFDSGKHWKLEMPEFKSKTAKEGQFLSGLEEGLGAAATWLQQQGVDAIYGDHLIAFGTKVKALTNADWDKAGPARLVEIIRSIDPTAPPEVLMDPAKDGPATYAFQTREGGLGVMQSVAFTENPPGVKIRYKLVQTAAKSAATGAALAHATPAAPTVKSPPKATALTPGRLNYFTTGHSIRIACSADGTRIAVANGNPTRIMQEGGTSRLKGGWKPTADILDAGTGTIVVSLKLTTPEEDAVLAATERVSYIEVTALAFSPAGDVVAVGARRVR